jgi:hypothetical protein
VNNIWFTVQLPSTLQLVVTLVLKINFAQVLAWQLSLKLLQMPFKLSQLVNIIPQPATDNWYLMIVMQTC